MVVAISKKLWEIAAMESLDQSLFYFINSTLSNSVFDVTMPIITDLHKNPYFVKVAVPLILAFWFFKKKKQMIMALIGAALCVAAVDNTTYRVLKPAFKRERPPGVEQDIKLRTDRYAGYSFPSNHAANNFAAATFLSSCYPALTATLYAVASLVAFSRVYVGVHYPADVLAGAVLGFIFGLFFFKFWFIILGRVMTQWRPISNDQAGVKDE